MAAATHEKTLTLAFCLSIAVLVLLATPTIVVGDSLVCTISVLSSFSKTEQFGSCTGTVHFASFFRCWLLFMPLAKCFLLQLLSIRARASTQLFRRTVSVALSRVSVFTLFCRLETLSQALTLLCPLCPHLAPQMEDNVCP